MESRFQSQNFSRFKREHEIFLQDVLGLKPYAQPDEPIALLKRYINEHWFIKKSLLKNTFYASNRERTLHRTILVDDKWMIVSALCVQPYYFLKNVKCYCHKIDFIPTISEYIDHHEPLLIQKANMQHFLYPLGQKSIDLLGKLSPFTCT